MKTQPTAVGKLLLLDSVFAFPRQSAWNEQLLPTSSTSLMDLKAGNGKSQPGQGSNSEQKQGKETSF